MRWLHTLRLRLRSLLWRRRVEEDLDEELRYHVDRLIEENVATGMSADEARHAALRAMGGVEQQKEQCRDARGLAWLDDLVWDIRFALRTLRKAPAFTLVVVGSLALGIGANSAIYSGVSAMLLTPLPYPNAERLVRIERVGRRGAAGNPLAVDFVDWRRHSQQLETIAANGGDEMVLTGIGEPERLKTFNVSTGFFSTFGVSMALGRGFRPGDDAADAEEVVVISHRLWQRRFHSDPQVIGRPIVLNDRARPILGVLSPDFRFHDQADVWRPAIMDDEKVRRSTAQYGFRVYARLRPGVMPEEAARELKRIKDVHQKDLVPDFRDAGVRVTPLQEQLVGGTRHVLLVLHGAVALILLIACANVANLVLARAVVRQKDRAILAALGARRSRLVRQMLTESLVLAAAGGACGLAMAHGLAHLLFVASPPGTFGAISEVSAVGLDRHVLVFTGVVSLATGIAFGLLPALRFSRPDLTRALKDGFSNAFSTRHRLRGVLLVTQVAVAVVLLTGAGLLLRSFVKLLHVDTGFRTANVLAVRVDLPERRYPEARRAAFQQQLLERAAALPGVEAAGAISGSPLTTGDGNAELRVRGVHGETTAPLEGGVPFGLVGGEYFRTMDIRLRAGRYFDASDTADSQKVAIVSVLLAQQLLGDRELLGKRLRFEGDPTVVGVVDDVRHWLDGAKRPHLYVPYTQLPFHGRMSVVVRSRAAPRGLAPALREAAHAIDPDVPLYAVMTMDERLRDSVAPRRFLLVLIGAFAGLALLLACVGVYGVFSYLVTQRTHEVGVRMALGAHAREVLSLFIKQGMALGAGGLAVGLAAAFALSRVLTTLLFDVMATDPLTFALVAFLMAAAVLGACAMPAWRATRITPLATLRHE